MNDRSSSFAFAFLLILLSGGIGTPAHAIAITVSFQASPFQAGAPTDPVVGSIVYDAASTTSTINSLTSINLTTAGHTYTLGEVGFLSPFGADQFIYGLINGTTIVNGTNDFVFRWNETTLIPVEFTYSAVGGFQAFLTHQLSPNSVSPPPSPRYPSLAVWPCSWQASSA